MPTFAAGNHLVVGAGPVGWALASHLASSGADVVIATRSGSGPTLPTVRPVSVDVTNLDALTHLVPDAAVIYNCVNPAYHRWTTDWPPMAATFLRYAEHTGAVLATCSNLYGYGPVNGEMTEDLPLAATGSKAQVRANMWNEARALHEQQRIRATEVRGSDYLCPGPSSLMGDRVVPRVLAGKSVQLVGRTDLAHSWTSPVDVARLLAVAGSDERAWGRAWHVPSNAPRTQQQVVDDLADVAKVSRVKVSSVPRAMMWALGLVNPSIRELSETDYQRTREYVLNDTAARTTFGLEPTSWNDILTAQVEHYR